MSNKGTKSTKVLFYVHFNKLDRVDEYAIYQLQQMRPIFDKVILLSNSKVSSSDKKKFSGLYDKFIQRKNAGYDFAAWRDGMSDFGWDNLTKYDELTIMNDTCFGPIYDFGPIYNKMQSKNLDFWGMTTNVALKGLVANSSGKHVFAPAHIQSYYMTFNKSVITSSVFKEFWTGVKDFDDVLDVIINYEIRLTELLSENGFKYDSYYNSVKYWKKSVMTRKDVDTSAFSTGDMKKYNPGYTCTRPLWLLETVDKYPFIKTKAIVMATYQVDDIRKLILKKTHYPIQLIDSYIGGRYQDLVKTKDDQIKSLLNSKTYRLGRVLTAPWRIMKGVK